MKIALPIFFIVILVALLPSCSKNTISYHKYDTLRLTPTHDASIYWGNPDGVAYDNNGSGASDLLRVGYSDNSVFFARTLLSFDVSSVPSNANIISATLSFTIARSGNNINENPISVYPVTAAWTEGFTEDGCEYANDWCSQPGLNNYNEDVTWNDATGGEGYTAWTTIGGDFVDSPSATIPGGGNPTFSSQELISDVKGWMKTPASNFGWIVKLDDESSVSMNGGEMNRFMSREASTNKATRINAATTGADPRTKPTLTIIYYK